MWVIGLPMLLGLAGIAVVCAVAAKGVLRRWRYLDRRQRLYGLTVLVALAIFVVGSTNFAAFWTIGVAIEGNADEVQNGRYYVSSHGRRTEVSRELWILSYYLARSSSVTYSLAVLAMGYMVFSRRLLAPEPPSLVIAIAPDGTITTGGKSTCIDKVVVMAESAKSRKQAVFLRREYPLDAAPADAVRLCHELTDRGILFQTIDG